MNTILLFALATAINVILSTIKSIVTVKGGKWIAALMNGITYGVYTYVIILTAADDGLPVSFKALITFALNVLCVLLVKWVEEKRRPVKMWKIEMALPDTGTRCTIDTYAKWLDEQGIPCNYQKLGHWWIFNCYCETCEQSEYVNNLCKAENGKISAYESKSL